MGDEHLVTRLHARRHSLALLVQATGAHSQYSRLVQLLDARLGKKDAGSGLGLGLDALDEDAVEEGGERLDGLECGSLQSVSDRFVIEKVKDGRSRSFGGLNPRQLSRLWSGPIARGALMQDQRGNPPIKLTILKYMQKAERYGYQRIEVVLFECCACRNYSVLGASKAFRYLETF